ncbi:uncharacterized protein LOC144145000 [Haemaphysalis longicornis]
MPPMDECVDLQPAVGHSAPHRGDTFDEAQRSGPHRERLPQGLRAGPNRIQCRWLPSKSDEGSEEDPFNDCYFSRWPAHETEWAAGGGVKRSAPERHEQCDDDLGCRRSPSRVCVKRARDSRSRCQCPYYRPVEATVDGVARCAAVTDVFDEGQLPEQRSVASPCVRRGVHSLCVCVSPYASWSMNICQPGPLAPSVPSEDAPAYLSSSIYDAAGALEGILQGL